MDNTILVVEDDPELQEVLTLNLQNAGYRVMRAGTVRQAEQLVNTAIPQLIVLDWMLPDTPGLTFARKLRSERRTAAVPIMLLTGRSGESDKITGLEAGADDYLIKPFSPRELLARIKAVLRRVGENGQLVRAPDTDSYSFGPWILKSGERELVGEDNVAIPLSTGEYNLLHAFVTHPRRVLSRDQLLDLSQGRELAAFERSIDNHISRLRRKIEEDPSDPKLIKTVWGGGYTLATDVRRI